MTLGNVWNNWPCYRCVFPKPPSPETVQSCGESGILGPVVGVMGVLMAVEAIKALTQSGAYDESYQWSWLERNVSHERNGSSQLEHAVSPTLLLYSAYNTVPFRTTYLHKPRRDCVACSAEASITRESLNSGSMDYAVFCGVTPPADILPDEMRISAEEFNTKIKSQWHMVKPGDFLGSNKSSAAGKNYVLVDVREKQDFEMCHIEGSFNLPFSIVGKAERFPNWIDEEPHARLKPEGYNPISQLKKLLRNNGDPEVYFICRYGNDSQKVLEYFWNGNLECLNDEKKEGNEEETEFVRPDIFKADIKGGLRAWSQEVDPTFPEY